MGDEIHVPGDVFDVDPERLQPGEALDGLWKEIARHVEKAAKPSDYPPLLEGFIAVGKCEAFADLRSKRGLDRLRYACLRAQKRPPESCDDDLQIVAREVAYRWVGYLIGDHSSRFSFYLQEFRARDHVFYHVVPEGNGGRPTLRPKSRAEWPGAWKEVLRWFRHPERLTVGELELALAVFEWTAERPRFVWWLRERPHILWRVHRFLLKRYGYELLVPFCKALRADGLDQPPFRAGELWLLQPRIAGLSFIGFLAVVGLLRDVDLFCGPCMAGGGVPPGVLWAGSLLCALLLWVVVYVDVFKQNRGVMSSLSHGVRRVWQTVFYFLWWGTVFSIGYVWGAGALLGLNIGVDPGYRAVAAAFTAAAACLIGALLQWFWEDRAATEPV